MGRISRRGVLASALATGVAASIHGQEKKMSKPAWDAIVIGAGVFGAWTAWHLRKAGRKVLLLDATGPAHARASSGGESRLTRGSYGSDEVYTRFALDSLPQWKWLSDLAGLPVFHPTGVVFFFQKREAYVDQSLEVHRRLKLPTQELDRAALEQRYPQASWKDVEVGLLEPQFGVLMARRAVQTLVRQFVKAGGEYRVGAVKPPAADKALDSVELSDGSKLSAGNYVFACGPWLPKVFPRLLGPRIFITRQEVFFFTPPAGDARFGPPRCLGGRISTTATSITACRTSRVAGSRSRMTSMGRRSTRIAGIGWRRRERWRMCGRTWRSGFRLWRARSSMKSGCVSTRTARTAIC
jgi:sarcosine oxidase